MFELPVGNMFGTAQPMAGATTYQVYEAATLAALYSADPQLITAAVPGAGAAGTEVIQTCYAFPVRFWYVTGLLCQHTNPQQFFELIYPQVLAEGQTAKMEPFLRWICMACMACHDQIAGQVLSSIAQEIYAVPHEDMELWAHRQRLLYVKLLDLQRPVAPLDQGLALVGGQLISEIRQTWEEARNRAQMVRTPADCYGALLPKHLCLAQVATEGELQPIHHKLARQNAHRRNRHTQHHYFETSCALHGKSHLTLPISPTLSNRLNTAVGYLMM
jgi:hypothetical protein